MRNPVRRFVPLAIAIAMVATIVPAAVLAQQEYEPAGRGSNAGKVDGKHAVGAGPSKRARKGKLVATNSKGLFPSNIVKPFWWNLIGVPAPFADGIDDIGYTNAIAYSNPNLPNATTVDFYFSTPAPNGVEYLFTVIPVVPGVEMGIDSRRTTKEADGSLS